MKYIKTFEFFNTSRTLFATLDTLKRGSRCIIKGIESDIAPQLLSMGIIIGEEVEVENIAPLGDPMIISCGSNRVSIRKSDARKIRVLVK